jgi:stage III sporulation protein AC
LDQDRPLYQGGAGRHEAWPKGKAYKTFAISFYEEEGLNVMDVDLIFKIAAIGILVSVLNQVLIRSGRDEQAMMTTLAGLIVVLMMVVQEISNLFDLVKTLFHL